MRSNEILGGTSVEALEEIGWGRAPKAVAQRLASLSAIAAVASGVAVHEAELVLLVELKELVVGGPVLCANGVVEAVTRQLHESCPGEGAGELLGRGRACEIDRIDRQGGRRRSHAGSLGVAQQQ